MHPINTVTCSLLLLAQNKGMEIKSSQQTHKVIFFLLEKDSQEIQKGHKAATYI